MGQRPLPVPNELTAAYWDGARNGRLVLQRCSSCGYYVHPPRPSCPSCRGEALQPTEVSGKGEVYSWSVMHSEGNPGFEDKLPYAVLVVELEEQPGLRTIGNLHGAAPSDLQVGLAVEVCFEEVDDRVTLPQWRPAPGGDR
jgi:hypothetical protein